MNAIMYRRVFDRANPIEVSFDDVLYDEGKLFQMLGQNDYKSKLKYINKLKTKDIRNYHKRDYLPVVELYPAGILSIDIDNLYGDEVKIKKIVDILSDHDYCRAIKGTPSGNLVAFFKFECEDEDLFPYLFYNIYLELTLLLSINIDFLPESRRLRYISNGHVYYTNEYSEVLTKTLIVENLPYIVTTPKNEGLEGKNKTIKNKTRSLRYTYKSN